MCVCMYLFMYECMYDACMHVCMYACMHVCMYACMHVCMYASKRSITSVLLLCYVTSSYIYSYAMSHHHTYMYACTHPNAAYRASCCSMHVCMYLYMYVCLYACMHVCMYACMHVCVVGESGSRRKREGCLWKSLDVA